MGRPGTYIPGIITPGHFIKDSNMIFRDVQNFENCIIVELKDDEYKQLVIEVQNPQKSISILTA